MAIIPSISQPLLAASLYIYKHARAYVYVYVWTFEYYIHSSSVLIASPPAVNSTGVRRPGFLLHSAREGFRCDPAADLAGTPETPTCRLQRLSPSANSRSIIAQRSHLINVVFHTKDDTNVERNLPSPTLNALRAAMENSVTGGGSNSYN